MKEDLWRLLAVMGGSFLIGLLTGQILLCLLVGLSGYVYWQYRAFKQLLLWLQKRSTHKAPEHSGLVDHIAREFDYRRSRHNKRKKKLSNYLKRFQKAVAALPDAVVVLGEHDKIEWANEKALTYIGIRWPQDSNQRISNLIRYPELLTFLEDVSKQTPEKRIEIVAPANAELRLEIRVSPYGNNQRLLVARNITKLHRINQMRTDFIANASHELRTPLTVISGYLEAFSDDDSGSPTIWQGQITRMRKQADRMRNMIESLLKLASLESEQKSSPAEKINVPDMITAICQEAIDLSDGIHPHKISVNVDPELWLTGDDKDLHSAFSNLIFNAVKYSPEGTEIQIDWYQDDEGAHFSASDSGEGIAPEHISRLTERFYRVDPGRSREKGGTGLGLAIVKHVLVKHRATLEIESVVGKGSTFRCNFPPDLITQAEKIQALPASA
jgi:two-component system phosphate regulon sensor histidine kinase PhoR